MQVGEVADDCVLFRNTETYWYKVQIYGAIGSSRRKANTYKEYSTDGQSLLVGVFEFMCNSDLIRIDE